jgi:AcrR family transcriptional regulator
MPFSHQPNPISTVPPGAAMVAKAESSVQYEMPVSKQPRSELSTRRLLDAAAELIAEVGYDRASLAAIGERAGYSHGLVTRRFGSKEGMLWALIERMSVQWNAETLRPNVGEDVGIDALRIIVRSIQKSIQKHPREMQAYYSLMFEGLRPIPMLHDRISEIHEGFRREVARYVRKGIQRGEVRTGVDPAAISRVFVGALRGCAYQWLLDQDEFPLVETLDALSEAMDQVLRSAP